MPHLLGHPTDIKRYDHETISSLMERHAKHTELDWATSYGEPGYTDPAKGILFANWNDCPRWLTEALERAGFELEWSDEWTISHENGAKAYRTSPDSHGWTPYFVYTEDGDVIGGDEIESGDEAEWYINEYLLNDSTRCNVFRGLKLAEYGFRQVFADLETGFHPGQNDNPKDQLKRAQAEFPNHDVVFQLDGKGQFDVSWSVWVRPQEQDSD